MPIISPKGQPGRRLMVGLCLSAAAICAMGCPRAASTTAPPSATETSAPRGPTASLLQPSTKPIPRLEGPAPPARSTVGAGAGGYRFIRGDYVTDKETLWRRLFAPYVGAPDVHYLEVGTYEGRSLVWMLDKVLTHPSARATGIDIQLRPELLHNLAVARAGDRVTLYEGRSEVALSSVAHDSVDIAYIDGSHRLYDCLSDAVRVWPLMKDGGVILFDDYDYALSPTRRAIAPVHDELLPRVCVEAFVAGLISEVEVLAWNEERQVAIRKRVRRCQREVWECTPLGERYDYHWIKSELVDRRSGRRTTLRPIERRGLEKLYASRRPDAPGFNVEGALAADPDVAEFLFWFKLDPSLFTGGVAPAIAKRSPGASRSDGGVGPPVDR